MAAGQLTPAAKGRGGSRTASEVETPAVRQYLEAKGQHPDCIVLFRLGDFFEIFGEDAEAVAPLLDLTLTARDFGRGGRMPMCGVPYHSIDTYTRKLLQAGRRLAICDQVETAQAGRLVARRVVRVLTPGTLIEDPLLEPGRSVRCVALVLSDRGSGMAALDVSTGDCQLVAFEGKPSGAELSEQLGSLDAAELLLAANGATVDGMTAELPITSWPESCFDQAVGLRLMEEGGAALGASRSGAEMAAVAALGGLASYCESGAVALDPRFIRLGWRSRQTMHLDQATIRNLELFSSQSGAAGTLFSLMDRTQTPIGRRQLRAWLQQPLLDLGQLHRRQAQVTELSESGQLRASLAGQIDGCRDLERLLGRCVHRAAGPRDLGQVGATLGRLPLLSQLLAESSGEGLRELGRELWQAPADLAQLLARALVDEPPATARDGDFIRAGYDPALDQIRDASAGARRYISELEGRERQRTGIKGLRVGFNRVFGYYLEVRRSGEDQIPQDYIRRQTLVGAERYVTAELKEHENVVLGSKERALARERECLSELMEVVASQSTSIARAARALGELDALLSLAEVSCARGWVMPEIDSSYHLELREGRHPLVEERLGPGRFVPNDAVMDGEAERIWLITGPNMAGKSTFLRQSAIICLLGQIGSAVPCRSAGWGLVDRIFTRVGAQDDIAAGRSTFMVEMSEMAQILELATDRSFLILDEIGRGTSTYDGMSIAQAILEHLHQSPEGPARTFFATHYHELTALEESLPALSNHRVEVIEEGQGSDAKITFLHRIVAGGADRSYGINVAQLAGIPTPILSRATEVLAELEASRPLAQAQRSHDQMTLPLAEAAHPMVAELGQLELNSMTPLEALQQLADWQRAAAERS